MKDSMSILVLDDDDIAFLVIRRCFYEAGLQPAWMHAHTVNEAIGYLQQQPLPDLVFIEPMLRDVAYDYNKVLDALADIGVFTQTRVCLLTTFLLDELKNLGKDYPVFRRFTKPFFKGDVPGLLPGRA